MKQTGETRKCVVCGKERYFYSSQIKRGLGKYCSMECRRNGEMRKCCVCGKEMYFRLSQIKRGYGKYCSRECKWKVERVEKKRCPICGKELKRRTAGCKTGKYCSYECFGKSLRTRRRAVCCHCGKEFERKPFQLNKYKRAFCSKECHDKDQKVGIGDFVCKRCGIKFHRRGRTIRKFCSSGCSCAAQQHRIGLNKLEIAGGDILRGLGVEFEEQILLFDKFTVDVFVRKSGLVIQWDGDYWHGNPEVYRRGLSEIQGSKQKHDKACNAYLRKCGLRVARFWERDVKRRPEWVASEIRNLVVGA